ncbi:hypothetical protein D3C78_1878010 [compost metagenome]
MLNGNIKNIERWTKSENNFESPVFSARTRSKLFRMVIKPSDNENARVVLMVPIFGFVILNFFAS